MTHVGQIDRPARRSGKSRRGGQARRRTRAPARRSRRRWRSRMTSSDQWKASAQPEPLALADRSAAVRLQPRAVLRNRLAEQQDFQRHAAPPRPPCVRDCRAWRDRSRAAISAGRRWWECGTAPAPAPSGHAPANAHRGTRQRRVGNGDCDQQRARRGARRQPAMPAQISAATASNA